MLVKVGQTFAMTMPCQKYVMDSCWKGHYEDAVQYCIGSVNFICDEKEVGEKKKYYIEKYIEAFKRECDDNVSGYTFHLPPDVYPDRQDRQWNSKVTFVKDMKMADIVNTLTGEQYAQFCKEMGICGACTVVQNKE